MITKRVDNMGRLSLGRTFAGRLVIINDEDPDRLVITPIPEREAWLYQNPQALNLVRTGLEQARAHEFVEGPDLKADASLASHL